MPTRVPESDIRDVAERHRVPLRLLRSVLEQESGALYGGPSRFEPKLGESSHGPMQVLESTARALGYEGPIANLRGRAGLELGARYLASQLRRYESVSDAVAAYNAGSARRTRDGRYVNQAYVDSVMGRLSGQVGGETQPETLQLFDLIPADARRVAGFTDLTPAARRLLSTDVPEWLTDDQRRIVGERLGRIYPRLTTEYAETRRTIRAAREAGAAREAQDMAEAIRELEQRHARLPLAGRVGRQLAAGVAGALPSRRGPPSAFEEAVVPRPKLREQPLEWLARNIVGPAGPFAVAGVGAALTGPAAPLVLGAYAASLRGTAKERIAGGATMALGAGVTGLAERAVVAPATRAAARRVVGPAAAEAERRAAEFVRRGFTPQQARALAEREVAQQVRRAAVGIQRARAAGRATIAGTVFGGLVPLAETAAMRVMGEPVEFPDASEFAASIAGLTAMGLVGVARRGVRVAAGREPAPGAPPERRLAAPEGPAAPPAPAPPRPEISESGLRIARAILKGDSPANPLDGGRTRQESIWLRFRAALPAEPTDEDVRRAATQALGRRNGLDLAWQAMRDEPFPPGTRPEVIQSFTQFNRQVSGRLTEQFRGKTVVLGMGPRGDVPVRGSVLAANYQTQAADKVRLLLSVPYRGAERLVPIRFSSLNELRTRLLPPERAAGVRAAREMLRAAPQPPAPARLPSAIGEELGPAKAPPGPHPEVGVREHPVRLALRQVVEDKYVRSAVLRVLKGEPLPKEQRATGEAILGQLFGARERAKAERMVRAPGFRQAELRDWARAEIIKRFGAAGGAPPTSGAGPAKPPPGLPTWMGPTVARRAIAPIEAAQYRRAIEADPAFTLMQRERPDLAEKALRGEITKDELLPFVRRTTPAEEVGPPKAGMLAPASAPAAAPEEAGGAKREVGERRRAPGQPGGPPPAAPTPAKGGPEAKAPERVVAARPAAQPAPSKPAEVSRGVEAPVEAAPRGAPERAAGGPGPSREGRREPGRYGERIAVAREEFTPPAQAERVPVDLRRHLAPHQIDGAALMLRAMDERGGALLADGTGVGKTRQILAIAETWRRRGHLVIIVAPNEVFGKPWDAKSRRAHGGEAKIAGSYADDGAAMGIPVTLWRPQDAPLPQEGIVATGYQYIRGIPPNPNAVLIFDESHALKNVGKGTQLAEQGTELANRARAVLFSTATPADKPTHIQYLARIGILEGKPLERAVMDLGFRLIEKQTKFGLRRYWVPQRGVRAEHILARMSALFDRMTAAGAMVKREIGMEGVEVRVRRVKLPAEVHARMAEIESHFNMESPLQRAIALMHQRRQQEPAKASIALQMTREELAAGRQVILFVARVNRSDVMVTVGYDPQTREAIREAIMTSEGTAKQLAEALRREGIPFAELHGGADVHAGEAMDAFQSGRARVLVATIESGATGINLDDRTGNAPRTMIVVTAPFGGVPNVQAAGRVWRLTTKSPPKIVYLFGDTPVDDWNAAIIARKMQTLGATVSGEVRKLDPRIDPDMLDELTPQEAATLMGGDIGEIQPVKPAPKPPPRAPPTEIEHPPLRDVALAAMLSRLANRAAVVKALARMAPDRELIELVGAGMGMGGGETSGKLSYEYSAPGGFPRLKYRAEGGETRTLQGSEIVAALREAAIPSALSAGPRTPTRTGGVLKAHPERAEQAPPTLAAITAPIAAEVARRKPTAEGAAAVAAIGAPARSFIEAFDEYARREIPAEAAALAERETGLPPPEGFEPDKRLRELQQESLRAAGQRDMFVGADVGFLVPENREAIQAQTEADAKRKEARAAGAVLGFAGQFTEQAPVLPHKTGELMVMPARSLNFWAGFQNRETALGAEAAKGASYKNRGLVDERALDVHLTAGGGQFDPAIQRMDPIHVWRDDLGTLGSPGQWWVLSGHTRTYMAAWRWKKEGERWIEDEPSTQDLAAIEFKGTFEEAREHALTSNARSVQNTYAETARLIRRDAEAGRGAAEIRADKLPDGLLKDLARKWGPRLASEGRGGAEFHAKNALNYSFLDPAVAESYFGRGGMGGLDRRYGYRVGDIVRRHGLDAAGQRMLLDLPANLDVASVADFDLVVNRWLAEVRRLGQIDALADFSTAWSRGVVMPTPKQVATTVGRIITRLERLRVELTGRREALEWLAQSGRESEPGVREALIRHVERLGRELDQIRPLRKQIEKQFVEGIAAAAEGKATLGQVMSDLMRKVDEKLGELELPGVGSLSVFGTAPLYRHLVQSARAAARALAITFRGPGGETIRQATPMIEPDWADRYAYAKLGMLLGVYGGQAVVPPHLEAALIEAHVRADHLQVAFIRRLADALPADLAGRLREFSRESRQLAVQLDDPSQGGPLSDAQVQAIRAAFDWFYDLLAESYGAAGIEPPKRLDDYFPHLIDYFVARAVDPLSRMLDQGPELTPQQAAQHRVRFALNRDGFPDWRRDFVTAVEAYARGVARAVAFAPLFKELRTWMDSDAALANPLRAKRVAWWLRARMFAVKGRWEEAADATMRWAAADPSSYGIAYLPAAKAAAWFNRPALANAPYRYGKFVAVTREHAGAEPRFSQPKGVQFIGTAPAGTRVWYMPEGEAMVGPIRPRPWLDWAMTLADRMSIAMRRHLSPRPAATDWLEETERVFLARQHRFQDWASNPTRRFLDNAVAGTYRGYLGGPLFTGARQVLQNLGQFKNDIEEFGFRSGMRGWLRYNLALGQQGARVTLRALGLRNVQDVRAAAALTLALPRAAGSFREQEVNFAREAGRILRRSDDDAAKVVRLLGPMGPWNVAEMVNRGASTWAAYYWAVTHGFDPAPAMLETAREYEALERALTGEITRPASAVGQAAIGVMHTQFHYGTLGGSLFGGGPFGRAFFTLTSYPINSFFYREGRLWRGMAVGAWKPARAAFRGLRSGDWLEGVRREWARMGYTRSDYREFERVLRIWALAGLQLWLTSATGFNFMMFGFPLLGTALLYGLAQLFPDDENLKKWARAAAVGNVANVRYVGAIAAPILEGFRSGFLDRMRGLIANRFVPGYTSYRRLVQENPEVLDALPEPYRTVWREIFGIKTVFRLTPHERAKRFLRLDLPTETERARRPAQEKISLPTFPAPPGTAIPRRLFQPQAT